MLSSNLKPHTARETSTLPFCCWLFHLLVHGMCELSDELWQALLAHTAHQALLHRLQTVQFTPTTMGEGLSRRQHQL